VSEVKVTKEVAPRAAAPLTPFGEFFATMLPFGRLFGFNPFGGYHLAVLSATGRRASPTGIQRSKRSRCERDCRQCCVTGLRPRLFTSKARGLVSVAGSFVMRRLRIDAQGTRECFG
jgi:hypothetical protein